MRKLIISLLLASAAAAPAFASPPNDPAAQQARQERREARAARQAARDVSVGRSDDSSSRRGARFEARQQPSFGDRSVERTMPTVERPSFGDRARDSSPRFERQERIRQSADSDSLRRMGERRSDAARAENVEQVQDRFERRQQAIRDGRLRERSGREPDVMRPRSPLVVSNVPRPGTQPPLRTEQRRTPAAQWSTHWRNNRDYDWQDHRRRHRSIFRVGIYFDPFGWNYRPYQIGWRMWPSYYSSRYWINDPWMYRLPYAPPGYRWIRYWDDALLVDTWSGQVVDRIPDFFW
ncbi:MAG TPA: RcnB family protein [Sphingomicrobium sp.]|jgi:hypothetical protein